MLKEDFTTRMAEIGSCEDDVERRTLIANLTKDVETDYDERDSLTQQNKQLADDLDKTQKANMDLFLQVTAKKEPDGNGGEPEPEPEKRKFEDLFNEKGAIK